MLELINIAVMAALAACCYALWIRRDTWGSRWDSNPSRILVFIVGAGVLMSPAGWGLLDPILHGALGVWNVSGLLAALCMFAAAVTMSRHLVTRLSDQAGARKLARRYITTPLTFVLPLAIVVYFIADRGQAQYQDVFATRGPWFTVYWTLICVSALYLFAFTGRLLLTLRNDPRSTASADQYLVWIALKTAAMSYQLISVLAGSTYTLPTWTCAGAASLAFAYAAAQSWQTRADWFTPARPNTADVADDEAAED
ncbi:hypothetical protein [Mycolicibacter hiberniae]|uniref:Uncharacterized protein n=1 Tax=Mycolicibacter hiberniae TaxID=29314 RepID=A0A7I7X1B7_9MYCO|nr:hypothetical protein [Mycolicibacter hiberniae]MCV7085595.1 hypothetical protein [Mycolicibacter hiberniae]ORV71369.1 hypothetical protein AWC09_07695 [Mycolicibacter hiberniae]BBZ22603.1 hypothetical protein MHIB_10210 [Mycolicibacter hiberniae]